jgi:hypothetical protein
LPKRFQKWGAIVSRGHVTGLHAVGSDDFPGGFVRDDEVFPNAIEFIFVMPVRCLKAS